jgi:HlyD family secretion protein
MGSETYRNPIAMKRRTKIVIGIIGLAVVGGAATALAAAGSRKGDDNVKTVAAERGTIVDKALAVGRIEPEVEIGVKSQISGVVQRRYAEEGQFVRAGAPLLEIKPTPTPLELAEARRQVQMREVELANVRLELERHTALRQQGLVSEQDFLATKQRAEQLEIQRELSAERLSLLEEGRMSPGKGLETLIRSPIDGYVLEYAVQVGDPVVPISTYQEGTVLIRMAEMSKLMFRGNVDEIDVGRLHEGLPVEIKIGALPDARVDGRLTMISLKATTEDNATRFPVEISVLPAEGVVLRAGYSANADVIIERRDSVIVIPERLVKTANDTSRVTVLLPSGQQEERIVRLGLSDAIKVEVVEGLNVGDLVVEPPPREIK